MWQRLKYIIHWIGRLEQKIDGIDLRTRALGGAQLSGALPIFGFNVQTRELIVVELVLDIILHWLVDFREVIACYVVCIKIWIKKFGLSLVLGKIYALKL